MEQDDVSDSKAEACWIGKLAEGFGRALGMVSVPMNLEILGVWTSFTSDVNHVVFFSERICFFFVE